MYVSSPAPFLESLGSTSSGNSSGLSEFSKAFEVSSINCAKAFGFSDYSVLIIIIVLGLLLGLKTFSAKYKSNLYMGSLVSLLAYIKIKESTGSYCENPEEKFLMDISIGLVILLLGYICLLQEEQKREHMRFEYPILILIAVFGLLISLENSEGIIIFLGLEVQAFTFYTLVSLKEKDIFSAEGALKYFLIGALASGLFILGLGLLYSQVAKTNFLEIAEILPDVNYFTIKLGGLLIITSLLFKIGAAPFHLWVADAYQGAPFYVLLFLITFPKIILYYLIYSLNAILQQHFIIIIAIIASSIIGSIQAATQTKIKRFIAYTIIF